MVVEPFPGTGTERMGNHNPIRPAASRPKRCRPRGVWKKKNRSGPVSRVLSPANWRAHGHPSGTKVALRL